MLAGWLVGRSVDSCLFFVGRCLRFTACLFACLHSVVLVHVVVVDLTDVLVVVAAAVAVVAVVVVVGVIAVVVAANGCSCC